MQVCRNGHVITDLLQTFPEQAQSHCDRCGATTLHHCQTCGDPIPGALYVPETAPIGARRPPEYCSACGAAFPWTTSGRAPHGPSSITILEGLLRRLPLVARQLRERHGQRQAFRVADEHDLVDLLRALLPLHFDDIRYESRTPRYAAETRTDFLLAPAAIALTAKRASPALRQELITEQVREDVGYYRQKNLATLVAYVFDPEKLYGETRQLELTLAGLSEDFPVNAVIAS